LPAEKSTPEPAYVAGGAAGFRCWVVLESGVGIAGTKFLRSLVYAGLG
jgi:hypothetical protein